MSTYLRLLRYVRPHLGQLITASVCMIGSSALQGVSLGLIIPLIDRILANKPIIVGAHVPAWLASFVARLNATPPWELLNGLAVFFIIVFGIKQVFFFTQTVLMNAVSHKIVRDLRNILYDKLLRLSMDFYSRNRVGDLVSRITFDTTVVRNSISEGLTDLVYQSSQILFCLIAVIAIAITFSIPLSLLFVTLLAVPAIAIPSLLVGRRMKKISGQAQESMADLNTALFETVQGMPIVKAFGMEEYERTQFRKHTQRFYKVIMKAIKRVEGLSPLTELVGVVCAIVVVWLGGRAVLAGSLSAGAFFAFLAALLVTLRPFRRLSRVHTINQEALAAATRVFRLLDEPETVVDAARGVELTGLQYGIRFEGVWFTYDSAAPVLKGVDLTVKPGQVFAVVGPSGVGKTTLLNLIPRFYDPTQGRILIDGRDVKEVKLASLRAQIGIVTQETFLFHDTVRSNIAYGRRGVSQEQIAEAARGANAHDFISRMPLGYDTVIGDRGFKLSGGERQRLAIARALLKNPPILILDEATSQLDTESERLVQGAIENLMRNRTVFVVAHRLSTVRRADRILVLDQGQFVEQGTHDELLAHGGLYKKLYELQFQA